MSIAAGPCTTLGSNLDQAQAGLPYSYTLKQGLIGNHAISLWIFVLCVYVLHMHDAKFRQNKSVVR
jgi:hypothetical protein